MKKILVALLCFLTVSSVFAVSPKERYKEEKEELEQKQIDYVIDWVKDHTDGYVYIYNEKDVEQKYDYGFSIFDRYNLANKFKEEGYNFEEYTLENNEDLNVICKYHYTLVATLYEYMYGKSESCLLFEAIEDEIIVAGYNNSKNEYFIVCIY